MGKSLYAGHCKFRVRGVTYGTFRPDASGQEFHDTQRVERDFAEMSANGINSVRVYTAPPRWLLDVAQRNGLYVMVGLPWEQHVAFLDDKRRTADIVHRVRMGVRACAGHPAVLCYAIGNEVPSSMVRWYGARAIQKFLRRLCDGVEKEDPGALVTYVNYPTTEYLELPFVDLVCFNVYLESRERLEAYLARLQNLAGNRPLLLAEVGLDSRRNGKVAQAEQMVWQIRSALGAGCAGVFVFSWTDEWHRGGFDIEDWDFGLTTRERTPKPALAAVRKAYGELPFPADVRWPRISVVVCSYNGSRTIGETLERLEELSYPDFEIIVVDDGSSDHTAEIALQFNIRLIRVTNGGLSRARNLGMEAASGEIVAYIDDDAYPDPDWLHYIAHEFLTTTHAAVGGPNIAPPGDGLIAGCVANSPGGPAHVLVSDREAEHIPGCNMAFRRSCLLEVGGFDQRFRTAGDDVDVCWRIIDRGWTIGFSAGAVVWHHRRNSIRTYLKQQAGYGKAEALLERKWPARFNPLGHLRWGGRIYAPGLKSPSWRPSRIYHGQWGLAPFQGLYQRPAGFLESLPQTPEWYLVFSVFLVLSTLGLAWKPLLAFIPLFLVSALAPLATVLRNVARAEYPSKPTSPLQRWKVRLLTVILHILQPVQRLRGRLQHGLSPWRLSGEYGLAIPSRRRMAHWSESWRPADSWLRQLESALTGRGAVVTSGGDFDAWDLEVRGGLFGTCRARMAVEEHGGGKQLVRFRTWPRASLPATVLSLMLDALGISAAKENHWVVCVLLAGLGGLLMLWILRDTVCAKATMLAGLSDFGTTEEQ